MLDRHADLLNDLSSQLFRVSERVGDGARTKLVNNLLAGINLVGAAEVMALAERLGLRLDTTLDVIERSSGQSWIGSDRMRRAIAGDSGATRPRDPAGKRHRAWRSRRPRRLVFRGRWVQRAAQVFAQAHAAGLADLDDAALLNTCARSPAPP